MDVLPDYKSKEYKTWDCNYPDFEKRVSVEQYEAVNVK
jgi:hypothetical protein